MAKSAQKAGPVPQEAKPASGAATTGETVTIACKMPNGIVLRGFRKKTRQVLVLGGGTRDEQFFEPTGEQVTILGNARPVGGEFKTRVVAGFALTQGVSKKLWDEWSDANKDMPAVKNGLIFAYASTAEAADAAKDPDNRKLKSGLEPINPNGDRRTQRATSSNVSEIQTRDDVKHDFEALDEEA